MTNFFIIEVISVVIYFFDMIRNCLVDDIEEDKNPTKFNFLEKQILLIDCFFHKWWSHPNFHFGVHTFEFSRVFQKTKSKSRSKMVSSRGSTAKGRRCENPEPSILRFKFNNWSVDFNAHNISHYRNEPNWLPL